MADEALDSLNFDILHAEEWKIEGIATVAGMRCPGGRVSESNPSEWPLLAESDLRRVAEKGFRSVYSLIETVDIRYPQLALVIEKLREEGVLKQHWRGEGVEIPDFSSLDIEELDRRTSFLAQQVDEGSHRIIVHCSAGVGRTSYILAALAIRKRTPDPQKETLESFVDWAYRAAVGNVFRRAEANQRTSLIAFAHHLYAFMPEPLPKTSNAYASGWY